MSNHCCSKSSKNIFQEAIAHCRWTSVLKNVLNNINIQDYNEMMSFEDIIVLVHRECNKVSGIGMLTIYDISSAICRFYNINIEKIYIIGKGPQRAVRLLDVNQKIHKIQKLSLKYVDIPEILQAFDEKNYEINSRLKNSINGDDFETYLCNWQKDIQ